MNYFFTILSATAKEQYKKNPIIAVIRYKDLGFVTLDFRKRDEAETCLNLDGTEYRSGYKLKIQRVNRFMDNWNSDIEKGRNPIQQLISHKGITGSNFTGESRAIKLNPAEDLKKGLLPEVDIRDNRIYMGGIPYNMAESQVKEMCEAFGRLKSFNLIKDASNPELNKGYAFFEYSDDRSTDKAIKALNGLEIKEKRLKVQKANTNQKPQ
jgi:hypothetical protein